jgi:hypothetical protein
MMGLHVVVFLLYMAVIANGVLNLRLSPNERRKNMRHLSQVFSIISISLSFAFMAAQVHWLFKGYGDVVNTESNIIWYSYHLLNVLAHLTFTLAVRVWLMTCAIRCEFVEKTYSRTVSQEVENDI